MKSLLRSNLDILEEVFPDKEAPGLPVEDLLDGVDEQIIDFSKADMSVDDLPADPSPEPTPEVETAPDPDPELEPESEPEIEITQDPDDVFNIRPDKEDT